MSNEALSKQEKVAVARNALNLCSTRLSQGKSAIPQVLESTQEQLSWLVDFFEGQNKEHHKLHQLNFGHYAVREIDPTDQEFVLALKQAYFVATKAGQGLKVFKTELYGET